jgi:hypothetical protein
VSETVCELLHTGAEKFWRTAAMRGCPQLVLLVLTALQGHTFLEGVPCDSILQRRVCG